MLVRIVNKTLQKMDDDPEYNGGYGQNIVKAFRTLMHRIRAADHEMDLKVLKSLNFEKLKGKRQHEHSMRLNDQFRLIFQIEKTGDDNQLVLTGIEDYH